MGNDRIILASGVFNCIHLGHLEYLKTAKTFGDYLIVLVDSNEKTLKTKNYLILDEYERVEILKEFKCVDEVRIIDTSVSKQLRLIKPFAFVKGGDRTIDTIPQEEIDVCYDLGIILITGVGKKVNSSSEIHKKIMEIKADE